MIYIHVSTSLYMKGFCLLLMLIIPGLTGYSQINSNPAPGEDSPRIVRTDRKILDAGVVTVRSFILPVSLFAYGAMSLNIPFLKSINRLFHDHTAITTKTFPFQVESYLQWTPVIALYGLNAAGIHGHHDLVDRTGIYIIALGMQAALAYEIKLIAMETRPNGQGTQSFPSGHTSNAFASAELLRREYKGIDPWYGAGGYLVALATAYLRMQHNKHWLGDVIGGAATGIFSTDLAYLIYPAVKSVFAGHRSRSTLLFPCWQPGGAGISLIRFF